MSFDDFYLVGRTMNLHVADEMRNAETSRLARIATVGRATSHRFYCSALVWVGARLVTWGQYLQARYDGTVPSQVTQAINRLAS